MSGAANRDEARARARALAEAAAARGAPYAWFEELYAQAEGQAGSIPWADGVPNPSLVAWMARPGALVGARTAAVVGCGLGHDAEALAARGVEVVGFDVSPTAIEWAKRLHPGSPVRYEVADLLAPPTEYVGAFDLVVEIYTVQALPPPSRPALAKSLRSLLAARGRLWFYARVRPDLAEAPQGPPWPLARREIEALFADLRVEEPLRDLPVAEDPTPRVLGVWRAT
jgi:SAM-dependent methyltransferase